MKVYRVGAHGVGYLEPKGGTHEGGDVTTGVRALARVAAREKHQGGDRAKLGEVVVQ